MFEWVARQLESLAATNIVEEVMSVQGSSAVHTAKSEKEAENCYDQSLEGAQLNSTDH